MSRIVARTEAISSIGDTTEVKVRVIGPKITPGLAKELRARAQAIVDVGPGGVAKKSASKVTAGELSRFTRVKDVSVRQDPDYIESIMPSKVSFPDIAKLESRLYTIEVENS